VFSEQSDAADQREVRAEGEQLAKQGEMESQRDSARIQLAKQIETRRRVGGHLAKQKMQLEKEKSRVSPHLQSFFILTQNPRTKLTLGFPQVACKGQPEPAPFRYCFCSGRFCYSFPRHGSWTQNRRHC
jgi:hypothetical protein